MYFELQVGGPDSLEKSLKAVRMAGWVHAIGVIGGVCTQLPSHSTGIVPF